MSDKPVIFISHSSKDTELAQALKKQIEGCFDNTLEAFASTIEPGENWFQKVMRKLDQADAIVTIITPNSVTESHWVWFELGYFWARHDQALRDANSKRKIYYPLYWNLISGQWPNPVRDLQIQAIPINDQTKLHDFFRALCDQFGGELNSVDLSEILEKFPKNSSDLTDTDIKAILYDYLRHQYKSGTWLRFTQLDVTQELPEGSTAKFIKEVAKERDFAVEEETENGIRLMPIVTFGPNPLADYRG